jgi:hypothetical protein
MTIKILSNSWLNFLCLYRHLVSDAWTRVGREEANADDMMVYLLCLTYVEMLIFLR